MPSDPNLINLILLSTAGLYEATQLLLNYYREPLLCRARLALQQDPTRGMFISVDALVNEIFIYLTPNLHKKLPELARKQAENKNEFINSCWAVVTKDFDKILRHRFTGWYRNIRRVYGVRVKNDVSFYLSWFKPDSMLAERTRSEIWRKIRHDIPLSYILTDTKLLEKMLFDVVFKICFELIYRDMLPEIQNYIQKRMKHYRCTSSTDDALNESMYKIMNKLLKFKEATCSKTVDSGSLQSNAFRKIIWRSVHDCVAQEVRKFIQSRGGTTSRQNTQGSLSLSDQVDECQFDSMNTENPDRGNPRLVFQDLSILEIADQRDDPSDLYDSSEHIKNLISRLPNKQQKLILYLFFEDKSINEIMKLLAIKRRKYFDLQKKALKKLGLLFSKNYMT